MKKFSSRSLLILSLLAILSVLMLASRSEQDPNTDIQDNSNTNTDNIAPPNDAVAPPINNPPSPPITEVNLPDDLRAHLAGVERIRSYSYNYGPNNQRLHYDVVGSKVKLKFIQEFWEGNKRYEYLYLDMNERTAFGLCLTKCDKDTERKYWPVDFQTYKPVLPLSIYDGIMSGNLTTQRKTVNNRDSILINLKNDRGEEFKVFSDAYFAFPHEVTIVSNDPETESELIQYFDVTINALTEDDVTIPSNFELLTEE